MLYQIAFDVDGPKERAALGRHGFECLRVRLPLVPLAIDVIVAAEDGAALVLGAAPRRSGVGGALGEKEQGASRTRVSSPKVRIKALGSGRQREGGLVAAVDEQSAAAGIDFVQFPHYAGQAAARLAGHAAVVVSVAGQTPQTIAIVGSKASFSGLAHS